MLSPENLNVRGLCGLTNSTRARMCSEQELCLLQLLDLEVLSPLLDYNHVLLLRQCSQALCGRLDKIVAANFYLVSSR